MPGFTTTKKTVSHSHTVQNTLTDAELGKISELIYQRSGIVITPQKREMVFNRLSRRLRTLGLSTFSQYVNLLESIQDNNEWQLFINSLTTNLTSFFRESYHFPILAEHARSKPNGYSVWCAAASTGEEPYSIAMTLDEALGPSITGPRIWATDIDTEVLQKALDGIYRLSDLSNLTMVQKRNYFLRSTGKKEQAKVKKELRAAVNFQQLNLILPNWDIPAPFDAIFCRNVMIYFDKRTQTQLMQRFAKMLKPGGLLFVGHSEHFNNLEIPFRLKGQSVYCLAKENT